jgi:hypothetical protein
LGVSTHDRRTRRDLPHGAVLARVPMQHDYSILSK